MRKRKTVCNADFTRNDDEKTEHIGEHNKQQHKQRATQRRQENDDSGAPDQQGQSDTYMTILPDKENKEEK